MEKSHSESYKAAGVDITAGYDAVRMMKKHVLRTKTQGVMSSLGGFAGMYELDLTKTPQPVLVSGTDGVGTKLRLAFLLDKHNTIGIDCVAMCVNDIICCGAEPLFFLDYIACGKNIPVKIASIVEGIAEGCVQAGCALVGGETAEMPGFYPVDEYDVAGYVTGVVDKSKIIDGQSIKAGDVAIALPSSGVHSNGFSLVRKVFDLDLPNATVKLKAFTDELGCTLGEALLNPTRIYVKPVLSLMGKIEIKGLSHITGGGFFENIPRCLPKGFSVEIQTKDIRTPAIFSLIAKEGNIPERDMFNTFNMGVGMCLIVAKNDVESALQSLNESGEEAYVLGSVIEGNDGVILL